MQNDTDRIPGTQPDGSSRYASGSTVTRPGGRASKRRFARLFAVPNVTPKDRVWF